VVLVRRYEESIQVPDKQSGIDWRTRGIKAGSHQLVNNGKWEDRDRGEAPELLKYDSAANHLNRIVVQLREPPAVPVVVTTTLLAAEEQPYPQRLAYEIG
jgi:hypothetical protein